MSIAQTKENIVNLLENIVRRSEIIERQSGARNLIEIDLALDDIRTLYREMEVLRRSSLENGEQLQPEFFRPSATEKVKHTTKPPVQSEVPARHEPLAQTTASTPDVQPFKETPTPAKPVLDEITNEAEKTATTPAIPNQMPHVATESPAIKPVTVHPKADQIKQQPVAEKQVVVEKKENQQRIVGEVFQAERSSVHERLAQLRDDTSIAARMQFKPISNIKEAIGLNEKFLFINELFGGDINAYNETIVKLNSSASMNDAFDVLNELTVKFNWDGHRSGETIDKFANLVQRRYMV